MQDADVYGLTIWGADDSAHEHEVDQQDDRPSVRIPTLSC